MVNKAWRSSFNYEKQKRIHVDAEEDTNWSSIEEKAIVIDEKMAHLHLFSSRDEIRPKWNED